MKVLTLNCWGLPWTTNYRTRIDCILKALLSSDYDLIILQEIFMSNDISNFSTTLSEIFPYIHYFYTGYIGSGVMFISKYCIFEPICIPYHQSGMIYHTGGDWFSRKSICYAKVLHPQTVIHVFGTHTHAKYNSNDFLALRTFQLYYLSRFIKMFTNPNDAIIVAGDLNTEPHEIGITFLLKYCQLIDPFYNFYGEANSNIYTCNDPANKYCCKRDSPCRIDYILHNKHFETQSYKVVFKDIPSRDAFYSDHYGIEVELKYKQDALQDVINTQNIDDDLNIIKNIIKCGINDSSYSLFKNLAILILIYVVVATLFDIFWRNYITSNVGYNCWMTIFYISTIIIWILSNMIMYISIRTQKRTFMAAVEEISNQIIILNK